MRPSNLGITIPGDTFREQQEEVIPWILSQFESGKKVVVLCAPPGAGKSLIAQAVARQMHTTMCIVTGTKQLQQQYAEVESTPKIVNMMGRGNFPCLILEGQTAAEGICTVGESCEFMYGGASGTIECPYYRRKKEAKDGLEVVTSYAYYLRDSGGNRGALYDKSLVVMDEAHELEDHIRSWRTVEVTKRARDVLGIKEVSPRDVAWLRAVSELASMWLDKHESILSTWSNADPRSRRDFTAVRRLSEEIGRVVGGLEREPKAWVHSHDDFSGTLSYRPVLVDGVARQTMWSRDDAQFLLMSATIGNADLRELGLSDSDYAFRELPSTFPVSNRPVIFDPVGRVKASWGESELRLWLKKIDSILEMHDDEKGLIHTGSYKMAQYIMARSRFSTRLLSHTGPTRVASLQEFKRSSKPLVMVSPSMTTGVDLPFDSCRFQIVSKISWPYRGDPQISARMSLPGGQDWYRQKAINQLTQAYGRAVRSESDAAVMYLIDGTFSMIPRRVLPRWFSEAIIG